MLSDGVFNSAITATEEVAGQTPDPLPTPATSESSESEDRAETADVTANNSKPAGGAPLVIGPVEFARLLQISVKTLGRRLDRKELPRPFLVGRQRRWFREEIVEWVRAGAPGQREWERLRRDNEHKQ